MGFADGGEVSKADQLMAEMAAKYGTTGAAQAAPVQQPAPQPQPKAQPLPQQQGITSGIVGILKGRQQQIDKAAEYAQGGIIRGPGTPTSDSIPAQVSDTGEPIKVSTDERIVSVAQGKFLEDVAKGAGFDSLDAMLEFGTGKPVGPTIKAGKRAAADGMDIDKDPFAFRGGKEYGAAGPVNNPSSTALDPSPGIVGGPRQSDARPAAASGISSDRINTAIAAPPTLGGAPLARSEPTGVLSPANPAANGVTVDPSNPKLGRDAVGIITADSAKAVMAEPMQRSGGISGTYDGKGVNDIMARENKARGEMIDSMVKANGGNGVAILPENNGPTSGPADGIDLSGLRISDREKARLMTQARGQDLAHAADMARAGLTARGLDTRDQTQTDRLDLIRRGQDIGLQRSAERNDVVTLGQDLRSEAADKRTTAITDRRNSPTLSQERSTQEIDTARERITGLTPEEIKRKTANFTATGRENPDYDPTLAKSVSLANRRKVGDDLHFDQRQQAQQPAGTDGDVMTRFRGDQAMQGHKLGKQTDSGIEVLDSNGRLIGHYR